MHRHPIRPGEGVDHLLGVDRLPVPLDVVPHCLSLQHRGVDPVDMGAATGGVHGTPGTHDDDWRPVEVGVIDGVGGVQQAHGIVGNGGHGASSGFGVPMGDLDRNLLMLCQHDLRLVPSVVHDRVVEPRKVEPGLSAT